MVREKPYGSGYSTEYEKWLKDFKLEYHPTAKHCLHWIAKGRCSVVNCHASESSYHWMDHVSCYKTHQSARPRIMICQPYHISLEDTRTMQQAAKEFDLYLSIDGRGWYGHGTCTVWVYPNAYLRQSAPNGEKESKVYE